MRWTLLMLVVLCPLVVPPAAPAEEVTPAQAKAAFGLMKQLGGSWDASSTQGWTGAHVLQILAGGSVLLSTSRIEPHPGEHEGMATAFHLDGDRLMLTHYCAAGNQPRLVATSISGDGRTIEFTFLDGTNMRSRDVGHMDRAIFTIQSTDRYTSRWTFYRDGRESWMEEITNTRRR